MTHKTYLNNKLYFPTINFAIIFFILPVKMKLKILAPLTINNIFLVSLDTCSKA